MFNKFLPIGMVVLSSLFYHISQKATPAGLNPIVTLIITYVTAAVVSILSYFIFVPSTNGRSLMEAIGTVNWASFLLGFAVVGLELGFLLAYRAEWQISSAGLIANTIVAFILIPVGILLFKETLSINTVVGIVVCVFGLVLVSK